MPQAQTGDISMYYRVYGQTGSPLILIMGLGETHLAWPVPLLEKLASKHRVIVFDNRGAGQTDKPAEPYTMAQFAADTVGLLDALNIEKAHVLGISMGGMIAQHVALNHPNRVLSLILGCTTAGGSHAARTPPELFAILTRTPGADRAEYIRAGWPMFFTPEFIRAQAGLLEEQLARHLEYPPQPRYAFELQLGAIIKTHHTFDRLAGLKLPVLIQTGLEDRLMPPENSRILAAAIPHARLIEYPGAAHFYFLETPAEAAADTLAFLAGIDAT